MSGLLAATGFGSSLAVAQVPSDADPQENTEQPKQAEEPGPLAPAPVAAPSAAALASTAKPKFGDTSTSGYFRGGFGATNQKGRMTCFALGLTGGQVSKYRLGNECEVWAETHFTMVVYANDDGTVATFHFMPTVYLPTENIGYSPTATISSPQIFTSSTGATVAFPNLYVDLQHVPWLAGGTPWMGTRYYKRESIYISDFFYWNPSGVGGGIEDINLGKDLRLSYAAFAMDGVLSPADPTAATSPSFPSKYAFGVRHDLQLRGIRPWSSGEFQLGVQYILNFSNDPDTSGGWGVTGQYVQKLLGGDNRFAVQYGRGGGTGFGTLARFYYPDFSLRHDPGEYRVRVLDVLTIQPTAWLGGQLALVFQRDDLGATRQDWYSAGGRLGVSLSDHVKVLGEVGYDRLVKADSKSGPQQLAKFTIAPALTGGKGFMTRPELRIFYTWAVWNEVAQGMGVDSGKIYNEKYPDARSGATFGLQAETWW